MNKILTKQIQNKLSLYFCKLNSHLTKPELRCTREITTGILKTGSVIINQIATAIGDSIDKQQTTKRLRNHYNKKGFFLKLLRGHMDCVSDTIHEGDYILFDGSDIQKKYAKTMEGLDFVKDGDEKNKVGLGYWLMNVVHIDKANKMTPLYNKLYSFDHGAKSENNEAIEALKEVDNAIYKNVTCVFDRGFDRQIIKDYVVSQQNNFIIRLKKNTKLIYKGKETTVSTIGKKIPFFMELTANKRGKNKSKKINFECGAVKVKYRIKQREFELWLVATKRKSGGKCWLLTNSPKHTITEVIREAFQAYGFRWKIEEYHRHIKSSYDLENIQIKKFDGLQCMLAILTIAMGILYNTLESMHLRLLLDSKIKILDKNKVSELRNFIYYKISTIIKILLANVYTKHIIQSKQTQVDVGQMRLNLDF
ncbi:transposase [Halosquirtibacter laminarini]|uniref:Transposase n=1 Tax=Halosquirtibacter laminarini TaxID=3374600 RepID=A0AC61NPJ2_9BACT|nr:transposase [Prolixibacteraceae bacterium]